MLALVSLGCLAVATCSELGFGPLTGERYLYEGTSVMSADALLVFVALHPASVTSIEPAGESGLAVTYKFESNEDFDLERRLNYEDTLIAPVLFGAVGLGFGFAAVVTRE